MFIECAGVGRRSAWLSARLQRRALGFVHSKFQSSLNISFAGELLHVGSARQPLCCFGVALVEAQLRQLLASCAPGDIVVCKDGALVFYGRENILRISLVRLQEAQLRIPRYTQDARLAAGEVYFQLARTDHLSRIGLTADGDLKEAVRLLLRADAPRAYAPSLRFFIGRGRGLTPAGDDILLGYGAALTVCGQEAPFAAALREALAAAQTTDVSLAYYRALLAGHANEDFVRLAAILQENDPSEAGRRIEAVRWLGHTSGSDTLFGFYLGLQKTSGEDIEK